MNCLLIELGRQTKSIELFNHAGVKTVVVDSFNNPSEDVKGAAGFLFIIIIIIIYLLIITIIIIIINYFVF